MTYSGRRFSPAAATAADALAARFDDHQFVFIGSLHGDAKIDEFLMCLVSRPVFKQQVSDIVVEWASSGQQRLLDRYLLTIGEIPVDDLAPIWLDTDTPTRSRNFGCDPLLQVRLLCVLPQISYRDITYLFHGGS